MANEILEQIPPLLPIDFFSLSLDIAYAKSHRQLSTLPDTSELLGEESFAEVSLGWNEEGIFVHAKIERPFQECFFPDFKAGDALELFFDTRDLKTAGFPTRFCHHFVILPQEVQGIRAQEITHFRTEDTHPLCDSDEIKVDADFGRKSYEIRVQIPAHCLHGYDPRAFDRLGFSYRINRYKGEPQHFSVSSQFYTVEAEPSLWSSLKLVKR